MGDLISESGLQLIWFIVYGRWTWPNMGLLADHRHDTAIST